MNYERIKVKLQATSSDPRAHVFREFGDFDRSKGNKIKPTIYTKTKLTFECNKVELCLQLSDIKQTFG